MTSNGTPAKPNCAEGLRAGRNEIPVTQAPNVNTRWVVGGCFGGRWRGPRVCSRCTSLRRWPRWRRYVFQVVWIRMNPYGPISTRGGATAFVYLFPFSCTSLCKPNLISSFAAGGEKKKKKTARSNLYNAANAGTLNRALLNYLQFHGCQRYVLF